MTLASTPLLGIGEVRHARLRPVRHAFTYPTYFLLLPMRSLRARPAPALSRNRFGLLAFHDRDHGVGGADSLAWFEALLHREGIEDATGEVWLHCYPRVLGFTFKPVSFWYGHRSRRLARRRGRRGQQHLRRAALLPAAWRTACIRPRGARCQALPRLAVLRGGGRLPLPVHAHRPASGRRRKAYRSAGWRWTSSRSASRSVRRSTS